MLLGAFRLLGVSDDIDDLSKVAPLARNRKAEDLRAAFAELQARGVVQRHGRLMSLQPKPLALALAERQWKRWGEVTWDEVLAGNLPARLRGYAAWQLSVLNTGDVAPEVARRVLRLDGPFASLESLKKEGAGDILSALAEIDGDAVAALLERLFAPLTIDETREIRDVLRRGLVHALEKIAFVAATFETVALLLLKLAVAENEHWGNNSVGQFKGLFYVFGGGTAAGAEARLSLFDDLLKRNDPMEMPIVVDALIAASGMHTPARIMGAETQGSRPQIESWQPKIWKEAWDYVVSCASRVIAIALRTDALGAQARNGIAHEFRAYVTGGILDKIESWVATVRAVHPYWPAALTALGDVLQYDKAALKKGDVTRVRKLIADLTPQDLANRLRLLVTEMPWDYPVDENLDFGERERRQAETIRALADDALRDPETLRSSLAALSRATSNACQSSSEKRSLTSLMIQ